MFCSWLAMSMNDQLDSVKMFGVSSDRVDVEGFLVRAMTAADENAIVVEPRRRHTDLPSQQHACAGMHSQHSHGLPSCFSSRNIVASAQACKPDQLFDVRALPHLATTLGAFSRLQ